MKALRNEDYYNVWQLFCVFMRLAVEWFRLFQYINFVINKYINLKEWVGRPSNRHLNDKVLVEPSLHTK